MLDNNECRRIFPAGGTNELFFDVPFQKVTDIHVAYAFGGERVNLERNTDFTVEEKSDYSNGAVITILRSDFLPGG